jgi:hypothetical protein
MTAPQSYDHIFTSTLLPFVEFLYLEAGWPFPKVFHWSVEGPRVVAAFRAQGMAMFFEPEHMGRPLRGTEDPIDRVIRLRKEKP